MVHSNLVIMFNCAQQLPPLMISHLINVLPTYGQCPDIRIGMRAKFILSFLDYALYDYHTLDLSAKEVDYIGAQLVEAMVSVFSSHRYSELEVLQVLTNLTKPPYFSRNISLIFQGETSIITLIVQLLCSSQGAIQKSSLRLLLNLYSFSDEPSLKHIHGGSSSSVLTTLNTLASSEDTDMKELSNCVLLLLTTKSKYIA